MKTNTHGLKMIGLKKASGSTENYGYYDGRYDQVFYDRATGEIWTVFHCSLGHNSWSQYDDENVIWVCDASHHMTMQQIADAIVERINELDRRVCG